jgi:hypothetical protein
VPKLEKAATAGSERQSRALTEHKRVAVGRHNRIVSPHEHVEVAQLAEVHAVARKLAWSLRSGEDADRLINVGTHLPTKPPIAGVYALLVLPTRYQSVFEDVKNWYDEQSVFYVGEAVDVCARLMAHRNTLKKMMEGEIKAQRQDGDGPRIDGDGIYYTSLEVLGTTPTSARSDRLLVEALLVAALRPVANDLGFGTGHLGKAAMWTILGPLTPERFEATLAARTKEYLWPVGGEWGTQEQQAEFTANDPKSHGEAHQTSDDELKDTVAEQDDLHREADDGSQQQIAQEELSRRGHARARLPPSE